MEIPKKVHDLNKRLGEELGFNIYGDPLYKWEYSNDLMWPAFATGKMSPRQTEGGIIVMANEYVQLPQTEKRDCWIVTKWFAPEDLSDWQTTFPGADYPARGYRVFTDWYNKPGVLPDEDDTSKLIWALRQQMSMSGDQFYAEMDAELKGKELAADKLIEDAAEDCIPAFVNATPGKRGGYVSMPYTKQDRMRDGSSSIN